MRRHVIVSLWLLLLWPLAALAQPSMTLTETQYAALKADILATPALTGLSDQAIADYYNDLATPAFWVWRVSLTEKEVYEATVEAASWSWSTYKSQTVQDRDAWASMWRPGAVNPSLKQTRDGWQAIFGGQGASATQVNYLLALSRRQANRAEKLFATTPGVGSTADPAMLVFVGTLTQRDIAHAVRGASLS
jgi:hypothetical protein